MAVRNCRACDGKGDVWTGTKLGTCALCRGTGLITIPDEQPKPFKLRPDPDGPYSIGSEHWPGTSKVIEECGELVQALGKVVGNGGGQIHFSGADLHRDVALEIGDVLAAIRYFLDHNSQIDPQTVHDQEVLKRDRFERWHGK